jgi:hypothetical protein
VTAFGEMVVAARAGGVHPRSATTSRGSSGCVLALLFYNLHCALPSASLARHISLPARRK